MHIAAFMGLGTVRLQNLSTPKVGDTLTPSKESTGGARRNLFSDR